MPTFDINSGQLITANAAATMLQDYMAKYNIDPTDPTQDVIYGYAFGLNTLKAMITEIDSFNASPGEKPPVIGIRVYKCINTFDGKQIEDVFLIPITAANTDFYPVRTSSSITQFTSNLILDNCLPCPNSCP